MKKYYTIVLSLLLPLVLHAQEVKNTSYTASNGEKVLRIEFTVPLDKKEAWNLFATEEGLKQWLAPVVSLNFRVGGSRSTNYDKTKSASDSGSVHTTILNYLEGEMITEKVNLNGNFGAKARNEDKNLQQIVQFFKAAGGKTKIVSSMIGWGTGPEWDKTYAFFAKGNEWTAQQIVGLYHK